MLERVILVTHIIVVGYWLGADLVINSTYRYVCWSSGTPFAERNRLMEHVMSVDQHVRYALVLQFGLGAALAFLRGYLPGGMVMVAGTALVSAAWIVLLELVHRLRHTPAGALLDKVDLGAWGGGGIIVLLAALAGATHRLPLPGWLIWKLALFAGVFLLGIGIRVVLIGFFCAWADIARNGSSPEREAQVRRGYVRASLVLLLLWVFIAGIVLLSVLRPS